MSINFTSWNSAHNSLINQADTVWVLCSTALVFVTVMTIKLLNKLFFKIVFFLRFQAVGSLAVAAQLIVKTNYQC